MCAERGNCMHLCIWIETIYLNSKTKPKTKICAQYFDAMTKFCSHFNPRFAAFFFMPEMELIFGCKKVSGLQELSMTWSLIYALNSWIYVSAHKHPVAFNRGLIGAPNVAAAAAAIEWLRIYFQFSLNHICKPNIWLAYWLSLSSNSIEKISILCTGGISNFWWLFHMKRSLDAFCLLSWNYIMWDMHHNRNTHRIE